LIAETGAPRDEVCAVLDRFRADECSFLVPSLSSSPTAELPDETIIDVGHEALLRRWTRVCGDPDATGERGDKREIGWLRQELRDGERYRFLHSCVDPQSLNESRLSNDQARRYWDWWDKWRPNAAWAARYGGQYDEVERLVRDSYAASGRSRQLRNATYAVIGVAMILLAAGGTALYRAEETFREVAKSTKDLSSAVLDSFNAGQTSLDSAIKYRDIAKKLYDRFDDLPNTGQVAQLKTSWLLTSSDLNIAIDDKPAAKLDAAEAAKNARAYLDKNSDDRGWLRLLYGALFRLGDLDLDESAIRDGTGAIVGRNQEPITKAFAEYQESQNIAGRVLDYDVTHPTEINPVSVDYLALQRFELAFAINKTGEALQVRKDYQGAIAKFTEALEYATMIEGGSKMEWKLQAAATQIKIGRVLRDAGDIDGALQSYSDAITRQELLFRAYPGDKILRANLGSAYEDRATLYRAKNNLDLALGEYAKSLQLFGGISEEDPRDAKMLDNLARIRAKSGALEEAKASLQNQPPDKAVAHYRQEVAIREKLAERRAGDSAAQDRLGESRARLKRVEALATPRSEAVTEKSTEANGDR
jgi:tetratricopeptide (TPR) repeat protein